MILRLPLRGWEPNEEVPLLFLVEFGVTAFTAGGSVLVDCHEYTGTAFGADGFGSFDLVAVDFVCVAFLD
jgi:hypothetical protein